MICDHLDRALACLCAAFIALPAPAQWVEDDCEDLVTATGSQDGSLFGDRVEAVGDVNGDGVPDFAVAAPFFNTNRGQVSVHSGIDGSQIWAQTTTITSTILGFSLAVAGDLDGDGVREVLAGAPFATNTGGFVFLYSGADGTILHTFQGDPEGFNAALGWSVAAGGDFDGDGVEDLVIGDGGNDEVGPNAGRVSVYSGDDFSLVTHIYPPPAIAVRFGTGVEFLGDVNDDGRDDLVIAERRVGADTTGRLRIYAFDGLASQNLATINGVTMGCILCGDPLGGGKDADGDGIGDFVVAEIAPQNRARVFSGADAALIVATPPGHVIGSAELVADVDGDGRADLLTGNSNADDGGPDAGMASLYSSADGALLRTMTSTNAETGFGTRVSGFDDLDGDGVRDLLVGARSGLGHAYVMRGIAVSVRGDIDGDGVVGLGDLLLLLSAWGPCPKIGDCPADLDGDGAVGLSDLLLVLAAWGS